MRTNPSTALDSQYDCVSAGVPEKPGTSRSCAVFCTASRRTNGALTPSRSKFVSKRKLSSAVTDRFRPHASVESICTVGSGKLTEIEPVTRLTLSFDPGEAAASGLSR